MQHCRWHNARHLVALGDPERKLLLQSRNTLTVAGFLKLPGDLEFSQLGLDLPHLDLEALNFV
jgi:hypothetical protein